MPITRQAYEKLKFTWVDDQSFRKVHRGEPRFLARLDKMVAQPTTRNTAHETATCLVPVALGIGVAHAQDINLLAGPSILAVGQPRQPTSASARPVKTSTLA